MVALTQTWERRVNEIIFLIEDAPEGGFTARALDASIFTEAPLVIVEVLG